MVKTWQERVKKEFHSVTGVTAAYMQSEINELRAKLAAAETSANELRRAVAELIGADPETWPNHGNAPLAIAACVAVRQAELAALKAQEPVAWTLGEELGFLDKTERCSATMFSFKEPDQAFIPLFLAAGTEPNKQVIEELEQLKAKLADQTKAADHWMGEACKSHNDLVRANEKLAALLAQEPAAWLYEVNGRIKLETKRLDNYYWMGEGDSWVKGKPLILAEGSVPANEWKDAVLDALRAALIDAAAGAAPVQSWPKEVQPDGSINDVDPADMAAGAAPAQQEPEPIQVCRLMKKEEGIWVAASEFYAGHPDQKWVKLVSINPGYWSIQRRVTGKQIADGLAKALAGTPPALEVTECQWSFEDDDSGTWRSSCGELWSFIDGGPNENRVTYCHHCGGKVSNAAAAPAAKAPEEPRIDINDLSGMIAAVIKEQP